MEDDDDDVQYQWQLEKSIKDSTLDSLCITNNEYSRIDEASKQVPYTSSSQKTSHERNDHQFSSFPSTKIISFGEIYGAQEFNKSIKRYDDVTMIPIVETQNNSVLAERKRRRRLTQLFVSLSTIIPGLNKVTMDYICFHYKSRYIIHLIKFDLALCSWTRHPYLPVQLSI